MDGEDLDGEPVADGDDSAGVGDVVVGELDRVDGAGDVVVADAGAEGADADDLDLDAITNGEGVEVLAGADLGGEGEAEDVAAGGLCVAPDDDEVDGLALLEGGKPLGGRSRAEDDTADEAAVDHGESAVGVDFGDGSGEYGEDLLRRWGEVDWWASPRPRGRARFGRACRGRLRRGRGEAGWRAEEAPQKAVEESHGG